MRLFRSYSALLALALLGCGGSQSQSAINLQGTWYFQSAEDPALLVGRHVIVQHGNEILVTYCNRQTDSLKFQDGVLVDSRQVRYYLQPLDSDHLVGISDNGVRSEVVKTSTAVIFDSGILSLLAPGIDELTTSRDVCAVETKGGFGATDGTEIEVPLVILTAPYKGTFIRVQAAFTSLRPGTYSVLDIDQFVHAPLGAANLIIESRAFGNLFGNEEAVGIVSGTLIIDAHDASKFEMHGVIKTTEDTSVSFSANVVLGK